MKEVLILTGACGVGKSTIAKEWAKIKNGATIECDYFTEWIYKKDWPQWTLKEEEFVAQLSIKTTLHYLEYGMPCVIENVWFPPGIDLMKTEFENEGDIQVKIVRLYCHIDVNHKRDKLRIPEDQMKERVDIVNNELALCQWPSYIHHIDSTNLSIKETVERIINLLNL